MKAHFFEINTLIDLDGKCWIVDKNNPNKPIMKISKSDFNLMRSGIWRSHGNRIKFSGEDFWISDDLVKKIKIYTKLNDVDFGTLGISMQEFLNPEIIDSKDFELKLDIIGKLKNSTDHIYIICSKQTKINYAGVIEKLLDKLKDQGILVKTFYNITDSFYNIDKDLVKFKIGRLLLQHLLGYKTQGEKFIDENITKYQEIEFYDEDLDTLKIATEVNDILQTLLVGTGLGLREVIKEDLREEKPSLIVNQVSDNTMKRIIPQKVLIGLPAIIKTFESFRRKR